MVKKPDTVQALSGFVLWNLASALSLSVDKHLLQAAQLWFFCTFEKQLCMLAVFI